LVFDNVRVPKENLLPNVEGLKGPLGCLNSARYGIAWGVIGAAMDCYDSALRYSKERVQFGKPIAGFQLQQKKLADAQVKATKALTAEQKKQAALKKAGTVFDQEQIQLIAALKGKLSEEDRIRVQAQLAILNENDVLAKNLTRQILMAQDATGGLYNYFLTIGDAKIKNPFAFLDDWIKEFQSKLNSLTMPTMPTAAAAVVAASVSGVPAGQPWSPGFSMGGNNTPGASFPSTNVGTIPTGNFTYGQGNPLNTNVYVTVQGSVTTEEDLVTKIASGLQQKSLSTGDSSYINRRKGKSGAG
jgi:hypothetical protein